MSASRAAIERGQNTDDEIAWLRSFGWSDERIAERLGIQLASLKRRGLRRHDYKRGVS